MLFHAYPYDITADGFNFSNQDEFKTLAASNKNAAGCSVEEYSITLVDGSDLDDVVTEAFGLTQWNVDQFIERIDEWDDSQKIKYIIAVIELGYASSCDPDRIELDIYEGFTLRMLAEEFTAEGLFGDIPEYIEKYIDYDAIARDLSVDYTATEIAGRSFVYRRY